MPFRLSVISQILIWCLVWMALSGSRDALIGNIRYIGLVIALSFIYHAVILAMVLLTVNNLRIPRGRRESILFMGGQKTLTLAILLQVSLFPDLGMALAFCVIHHFIHLLMDGYLVGYLQRGDVKQSSKKSVQ
jgi:predicted Na+-dependent transporter